MQLIFREKGKEEGLVQGREETGEGMRNASEGGKKKMLDRGLFLTALESSVAALMERRGGLIKRTFEECMRK